MERGLTGVTWRMMPKSTPGGKINLRKPDPIVIDHENPLSYFLVELGWQRVMASIKSEFAVINWVIPFAESWWQNRRCQLGHR
jgi:hypothetical protein